MLTHKFQFQFCIHWEKKSQGCFKTLFSYCFACHIIQTIMQSRIIIITKAFYTIIQVWKDTQYSKLRCLPASVRIHSIWVSVFLFSEYFRTQFVDSLFLHFSCRILESFHFHSFLNGVFWPSAIFYLLWVSLLARYFGIHPLEKTIIIH